MEKNDLYDILELTNSATLTEIKTNFKKLALKYHPDKNKSKNSNEKFNQIRVAYEILSDPNKKKKYDNMITSKKNRFTETIFLFLKEITNPKTIRNLMNRPDIIQNIKDGNIHTIAQKLIQKILDNIDLDIDISKLMEIFIHTQSDGDKSKSSEKNNIYDSSNLNTLNIVGSVKITIDDIYYNRLKEIIIKRKIYGNGILKYDTNTYRIPLYDHQVIITGAGDKIINKDQIQVGDVILNIYCKKNKMDKITRNGYDLVYNETITLYELFNGFNKNINYFDSEINFCSTNPFKEYKFDGTKISINIKDKGLPFDQENNRGSLIINLNLDKTKNFDDNLKKYFG